MKKGREGKKKEGNKQVIRERESCFLFGTCLSIEGSMSHILNIKMINYIT